MCGLAGFLDCNNKTDPNDMCSTVRRMADTLFHRGLDDGGVWCDPNAGIALGSRRLSIIDLSLEGHQPMESASGRYVIAYNGEIYNFEDLRQALGLSATTFRGHSDTEVMLACFEAWGIEESISRFSGMFAFALWDRKERVLTLGRDRLGEKPLYYGWTNGVFVFGSELKAIRAHPSFRSEIDRQAVALYLRYTCIPAPFSIYKGILKLPQATTLTLPEGSRAYPAPIPYWSAKDAVEQGISNPLQERSEDIVSQLDSKLRDVIRSRMLADVPVGAFLSGGVDSSTLVALMQAQSSRQIRTFTIGFHESEFSEATHAKAVAEHLGTDHTELYIMPEQAMAVIPRMPSIYDEPFSDASQIPTYLVSEMAKKHVKVGLSGDGTDELFGGYSRYLWGQRMWQKIGWMPSRARRLTAKALLAISPKRWDGLHRVFGAVMPDKLKQRNPGDKLHKLAEMITVDNSTEAYLSLVSYWKNPREAVIDGAEPQTLLSKKNCWADVEDFRQQMMYLDTMTYLPDDILTKLDRASMGNSLEARVPFLDHNLMEFAWRIPFDMKIRSGEGKWVLRQVLYRYVPRHLIERPKTGFMVPLDSWLRGPLREWAEDLLDERRLLDEGFFHPGPIRRCWSEHLQGRRNWQHQLWAVLMFQAWLQAN